MRCDCKRCQRSAGCAPHRVCFLVDSTASCRATSHFIISVWAAAVLAIDRQAAYTSVPITAACGMSCTVASFIAVIAFIMLWKRSSMLWSRSAYTRSSTTHIGDNSASWVSRTLLALQASTQRCGQRKQSKVDSSQHCRNSVCLLCYLKAQPSQAPCETSWACDNAVDLYITCWTCAQQSNTVTWNALRR
jgi:hypothetical protein